MVVTLALIPAFSPQEKENRSPVSCNVVSRRLQEHHQAIRRLAMAVPSPWGEGQGEGGRENKFNPACTDVVPTGLEIWENRVATKIPLLSAFASGYGATCRDGREHGGPRRNDLPRCNKVKAGARRE
jgi:hypothetical protein